MPSPRTSSWCCLSACCSAGCASAPIRCCRRWWRTSPTMPWRWSRRLTSRDDSVTDKAIAITGGDSAYFELMRDCIGSLRAMAEGRAMALGVLDCGLAEEQRAWCRMQGATLVEPQWDFDFPGRTKLKDGY